MNNRQRRASWSQRQTQIVTIYGWLLVMDGVTVAVAAESARPEFALRDGDTVVFLGDSLTAARTYSKYVENFTLLRYPDRKIRFVNAGHGGDTAEGGLKRLERDVFAHRPTVVTVMYGTNDIGWGVSADERHKQAYLDGIRGIVTACRERNVRVFVCSEPVTAADPHKSADSFLQKMCDEGMALSKSLGGGAIDVQRSMREIQKRVWAANENVTDESKKSTMHVADGVHLNDLGQLAVAFSLLKGFGAPAEVSSVTLDFADEKSISASGCRVTDVAKSAAALTFTRLDDGLPFNYGIFFALHYRFVPVHSELARYELTVKNLPPGKFGVLADDRKLGHYSAKQLADGVNLVFATANAWEPGGPWNAQANALVSLTNARHELAVSGILGRAFLPSEELAKEFVERSQPTNDAIEELQRLLARPRPYRFVVRPMND